MVKQQRISRNRELSKIKGRWKLPDDKGTQHTRVWKELVPQHVIERFQIVRDSSV